MAYITINEGIEISVEEFFDSCSKNEKLKLQKLLNNKSYKKMSIPEAIFEDHLTSIHGKWNNLTVDEENQIMNISKKFK